MIRFVYLLDQLFEERDPARREIVERELLALLGIRPSASVTAPSDTSTEALGDRRARPRATSPRGMSDAVRSSARRRLSALALVGWALLAWCLYSCAHLVWTLASG